MCGGATLLAAALDGPDAETAPAMRPMPCAPTFVDQPTYPSFEGDVMETPKPGSGTASATS